GRWTVDGLRPMLLIISGKSRQSRNLVVVLLFLCREKFNLSVFMLPNTQAYAALHIPDYRRFLAMRLMTTLTVQIMSVSVGYYVYELTNDPLMLGFIGLTEAIPA
ncbi:MAG TPA: hypothetical protein DCF33_11035, partial [Saprospirales bacterium]|nr:hypothetical protein [Saprospirales bacterium]